MPEYVSIARDPFARFDTVREVVPVADRRPCTWCGQPARFRYGTQPDSVSNRIDWQARTFCCVGCMRTYYS